MSRTRHPVEPAARTASISCASGYTWRSRASEWGQLIFAPRGMMTVHTDAGLWVVPPHQAMWVPALVRHDVEITGQVPMRMMFFNPTLERRLPRRCRLVEVSPLLRELLRRALHHETLDRRKGRERLLLAMVMAELATLPVGPFDLRTPRDPRGARAAALVRAAPNAAHPLHQVAREAFASPRTIERIFQRETGLPFGAWRQRARLLRALQVLAGGDSATKAALAAGYQSTSAFVAAFRRQLGITPGRYFKRPDREETDEAPSV